MVTELDGLSKDQKPRGSVSVWVSIIPARGLVASLLFLSVPSFSVSFLLLSARPLAMALSVSSLLVLTVAIPLLIATEVERTRT